VPFVASALCIAVVMMGASGEGRMPPTGAFEALGTAYIGRLAETRLPLTN
jgi:hypothetical protein